MGDWPEETGAGLERYIAEVRISIGADDKGALTETVVRLVRERGHEPILHGDLAGPHEEYVDVAERVARDVTDGRADEGIVMCWTGTGVSIAANKVPGVRAALCGDAQTARGARRWNHANVLALSMRATSPALGAEILEGWFSEPYGADAVDVENVAKIERLERGPGANVRT